MTQRWLLLDFDNTMMATEQFAVPSLVARFNELYDAQIDHPLTVAEFKQHFHGQARENLCSNLSKHFNIIVDYPTLYDAREWRMMQHLQSIAGGIPMADNLIEALNALKAKGVNFAFVSNNPIQRGLAAMRFAANKRGGELANLFCGHFFEANDVQKPKPDIYLRAMEQLKTSPEFCCAIEDSVTGCTASVAAGITTFGYVGFADDRAKMAEQLLHNGCTKTFADWADFPKLYAEISLGGNSFMSNTCNSSASS